MAKVNWNGNVVLNKVVNRLNDRLELIGELVEGSAKLLAPVDLGYLKNSITHIAGNKKVRIGTNVEYAPYLEFGTGEHAENGKGRKGGWVYLNPKTNKFVFTFGNKPQPFLRPALLDNKKQIIKILSS